jgi:endoglucanase
MTGPPMNKMIAFQAEPVFQTPYGPPNRDAMESIRAQLGAVPRDQRAILSCACGGRWHGEIIQPANLAALWAVIAVEFAGHPALGGYELMQHPHQQHWGSGHVQPSINAIRVSDERTPILVPGAEHQSPQLWAAHSNDLRWATDPAGRLLYAANLIIDAAEWEDEDADAAAIVARRLDPWAEWLHEHRKQGVLVRIDVDDELAGSPADSALRDAAAAYVAGSPRITLL